MVIAGLMLIFLGSFTKLGAVLSTIPDPLVGGVLASSMAMVGGVAIANVQQVIDSKFYSFIFRTSHEILHLFILS